jgi:recombinational DNA repair ATPase RecF
VIKLESAHIEEVRGIRKLDIDFRKSTFAISGPNGSGKSGVIDALEFALTGSISRLMGRGTKGLSIAEHGPHVDKVKFPDAAFVSVKVLLSDLGKSATITRKVKTPAKPTIEPPDADIKAALAEVAAHPEIALSRREILRFILVEPTERSQGIQTILKLDDIGQVRSALNTAQNRLERDRKTANGQVETSRDALLRHLQLPALKADGSLAAVNKRRTLLGLAEIAELTSDTKLDEGITAAAAGEQFNKQAALRDLNAAAETLAGLATQAATEAAAILADIERLEKDPALLIAVQRHSFVEKGLSLVDGPDCPLCDQQWEGEGALRAHLEEKLRKSKEAQDIQRAMLANGATVAQAAGRLSGTFVGVQRLAAGLAERACAQRLADWKADLDTLRTGLGTLDGIMGLKDRLTTGWPGVPPTASKDLGDLTAKVNSKPNQTATVDAQTFLTTAQLRLGDYREAMRKNEAAKLAAAASKCAYDTYCSVMETELNTLYDEVQKDFSNFYRAVNDDDEAGFTAKLTPSEGSLGLEVDFYDRGLFPPAAFHSEGHQDGMGVCLYLALMKRLFGDRFSFALLDDVVMSVDTGHRRQFCKLLKSEFPGTQFVITTHDRTWAEQMKTAGLVNSKTSLAFHGWSIDTGPLVETNDEIWTDITNALARGKVETAAHALRYHLEFVARILADQLGATPTFRADGNYDLGELMPSVLGRIRALYSKAAESAQSWGKMDQQALVASRKTALSSSNATVSVDQWAVNKGVHYNEWANFGRRDFEPVVTAYKELVEHFRCAGCGGFLYVMPARGPVEALRCACTAINLNLVSKPKGS